MTVSQKENFSISLENFDGPLSTLLSLIEEKKVEINTISLAQITGKYLDYLKENKFRMQETAEFIWVAATLILIKSKSLLPNFILEEEEEDDIKELQKRLEILALFKKVSLTVRKKFGKNILYRKKFSKKLKVVFSPEKNINPENMHLIALSVLEKVPSLEFIPHKKIQKEISLKEIIQSIEKRITAFIKTNFSELLSGEKDKKKISVAFLAILELFKQGRIFLEQKSHLQEIHIEKNEKTP